VRWAATEIGWLPRWLIRLCVGQIISKRTQSHFVAMSAVTSGVADVKQTVQEARSRLQLSLVRTYLFLDEM
jgi:putative ATPase